MPRPNLLKIDDLLLRAARGLGVVWILGAAIGIGLALNDQAGAGSTAAVLLLSASAPLGLMIGGFKLRQREARAWALHRLVDDHVELPASDLLRDSDFTKATLGRAIRDLNNVGAAFLVWDREADVIQDGRLRSSRVQIELCGGCGAKVSMTLRVGDVAAAECPFCQVPLGHERWMEEKAKLIAELDTDPEEIKARHKEGSDFSVGLFVFLICLCWPLGLVYAFWKWRAGQSTD